VLTLKWVLDGVGECGQDSFGSWIGINGRLLLTGSVPSVFKNECSFSTSWVTNTWLVMKGCDSCSSVYWLVGWLVGQSVGRLFGWLFSLLVGWSVSWSVGLSVCFVSLFVLSVCLSVCRLVHWCICRLVGRLVS
jgi:hypothetical protein